MTAIEGNKAAMHGRLGFVGQVIDNCHGEWANGAAEGDWALNDELAFVTEQAPFTSDSLAATLSFKTAGQYTFDVGRRRLSGVWIPE